MASPSGGEPPESGWSSIGPQRADEERSCQRAVFRAAADLRARGLVNEAEAWEKTSVSTATTEGFRITVTTHYVPEQSVPQARRYVFAYKIRIENQGDLTAQLKSRHWVITDGNGKVEEVRGPGVIGQQPLLRPGEHFEYTSGCVLDTPRGTMRGTYQMHTPDGRMFDAEIASFQLAMPHTLN